MSPSSQSVVIGLLENRCVQYRRNVHTEKNMIKKLTRSGNSSVIVIERPILDLLNIGDETELKVTTDGRRLIIEPVRAQDRAKKFSEAVAEADAEYGRMFKNLAK
jgi:antitoxin component of MazEF toxin-antitoxin module